MLPGTKYTPESVLQILRRHVWLIVIPLVVGTAGAYWWARQAQNLYRAETVMMLMPQRISDGYVKSAVNAPVAERLTTLMEQVLSRPHLEKIIQDLNLYTEERRTSSLESVVERMRKGDTTIKAEGQGTGTFRLAYVHKEPVVAQKVTERLAGLFNDENLKYRENVAETTNAFLDSQMAEAKQRLLEQEKKVQEYKQRYGTELPSQVTANLQSMQGEQGRLGALADAMDRDRGSRQVFERQLADLEAAAPDPAATTSTGGPGGAGSGPTVAQQLAAAKAELTELEMRKKPDHPDVGIQQRKIRDLEAKAKAETEAEAQAIASPGSTPALSAAEVNRQRRVRDLKTQMADIDVQLEKREQQGREIRASIAQYEARLNALPTRESELVELTRDYSTLLNSYNGLSAKRQESTLSANLERQDVGEQFKIIEPPRVPEVPFSPDRSRIQIIGSAVGLVVGLALVGFLEYRDSSFKTEEEIFRILDLPVLAVIPLIVSPAESEDRKNRLARVWATISGVSVVAVGVAAWLWRLS